MSSRIRGYAELPKASAEEDAPLPALCRRSMLRCETEKASDACLDGPLDSVLKDPPREPSQTLSSSGASSPAPPIVLNGALRLASRGGLPKSGSWTGFPGPPEGCLSSSSAISCRQRRAAGDATVTPLDEEVVRVQVGVASLQPGTVLYPTSTNLACDGACLTIQYEGSWEYVPPRLWESSQTTVVPCEIPRRDVVKALKKRRDDSYRSDYRSRYPYSCNLPSPWSVVTTHWAELVHPSPPGPARLMMLMVWQVMGEGI